jgi:hypothetical protein
MSSSIPALKSFYCKPGVSTKYKGKVGLVAVKDIAPNTKILERPHYMGKWVYTKDLHDKLDVSTIESLQDLYRNKRLFMQDKNRMYTFIPHIPIKEYHAEMFINQSRQANVCLKNDGYFTNTYVKKGDELFLESF